MAPFRHLRIAVSLLSMRSKRVLSVAVFAQMLTNLLDLLGVFVIGALTSLVIRGLNGQVEGNRVSALLEFLNLSNLTYEQKTLSLLVVAVFFLLSKSILSMLITKRLYQFLANRSAEATRRLLLDFFAGGARRINSREKQSSIFALTFGVSTLILGVLGSTISLIVDAALLAIMLIGLFYISATTTTATVAYFFIVAILVHRITNKQLKTLGRQHSDISIRINSSISDILGSYRELYVRNALVRYVAQIGRDRFLQARIDASLQFRSSFNKYVYEIALILGILLLILTQASRSNFAGTTSTTAIFIAAAFRVVPALARIQSSLLAVSTSFAQAEVTVHLIQELRSRNSSKSNIESQNTRIAEIDSPKAIAIKLKKLDFSFEDSKENQLSNLNLEILRGEKIGLIGSTGEGKSTLIDLILGILRPSRGQVEIFGVPPKSFFEQYPGKVALVPQKIHINSASLRENLMLGLGAPVSDKEIWSILDTVDLANRVRSFDRGLENIILENDGQLSGGQKQALGLARALLSRPEILVMDESTSAMDSLLETKILENVFSIPNLTVLFVSHRVNSLKRCDSIWKLSDSNIQVLKTNEVISD